MAVGSYNCHEFMQNIYFGFQDLQEEIKQCDDRLRRRLFNDRRQPAATTDHLARSETRSRRSTSKSQSKEYFSIFLWNCKAHKNSQIKHCEKIRKETIGVVVVPKEFEVGTN
jgi:hypothetical protein